ncbi:hypothetical protein KIN20_013182 [Parelaphostrongylus tenuis]|uniref:Uncharacterized protein n=1 Tax=Parelaphostrongylus tenuis TaxID=148309 RepID=A0AAD5MF67_PARTN|nr:hypothetical protein KIN20_013182 [Parelaphostrongylus tenuis]
MLDEAVAQYSLMSLMTTASQEPTIDLNVSQFKAVRDIAADCNDALELKVAPYRSECSTSEMNIVL